MLPGILQKTLIVLGYAMFSLQPQSTDSYSKISVLQPVIKDYYYSAVNKENLLTVSKNIYGSVDYWSVLWNDNPEIINPSDDLKGMKLKIRFYKPLIIENVKQERMSTLLLHVENEPLDSRLAYAPAESDGIKNNPNKELVKETVQASVSHASPIPKQSNSETQLINVNYEDIYRQAGDKFGVPWQVLYGLHLTETGQRDGAIYNGQGSGAQGPMQFMPGTWKAYGVDGNGDGTADINNAIDSIHGAANFLAKHGELDQGLRSYGGNISGILAAACERGYCQ